MLCMRRFDEEPLFRCVGWQGRCVGWQGITAAYRLIRRILRSHGQQALVGLEAA